jgi:DNA topoisomerase-3
MKDCIPELVKTTAAVLPFTANIRNINVSQVIDNTKVSDHHAIVPTPTLPETDITALPSAESNILNMIITRLITAVSDKHIYTETVITVECEGETFAAKGNTVIQNGWKTVEQAFMSELIKSLSVNADKTNKADKTSTLTKTNNEVKATALSSTNDDTKALPDIYEGYSFIAKAAVREGFNQPLRHYTEDTLLSAMENAGADDMPSDAERKGLGTPATRAGIIENLVKSGFIERKGRNLIPTEKGMNLIKILPESVKSPMLTAEWENHLKRIEYGELTSRDFMTSIEKYVEGIVKTHAAVSDESITLFKSSKPPSEIIGSCPRCASDVTEFIKGYFCVNKTCTFGLFKENRFFTSKKKTLTKAIAAALLKEERVFISGLVSEKTGKSYNATVILHDSGEGYPSFRMVFEI